MELEYMSLWQRIREIENDITELKIHLCSKNIIQPEVFLTDADKGDLLNHIKYTCIVCKETKDKELFDTYNNEKMKGFCKECSNIMFPEIIERETINDNSTDNNNLDF